MSESKGGIDTRKAALLTQSSLLTIPDTNPIPKSGCSSLLPKETDAGYSKIPLLFTKLNTNVPSNTI